MKVYLTSNPLKVVVLWRLVQVDQIKSDSSGKLGQQQSSCTFADLFQKRGKSYEQLTWVLICLYSQDYPVRSNIW